MEISFLQVTSYHLLVLKKKSKFCKLMLNSCHYKYAQSLSSLLFTENISKLSV